MLLNLSNHPSEFWSERQKSEAENLYGKVFDIPFPKIEPTADEEKIEKLAENYFNIIKEKFESADDKINAVHIMGELTFVYSLVKQLIDNGITCVASTTKRKTIEFEGGKLSEFKFVRFREYK